MPPGEAGERHPGSGRGHRPEASRQDRRGPLPDGGPASKPISGNAAAGWEAEGRIDPFPLGQQDVSDRLLIPERLYGREAETTQALLAAVDRVVAQGATELVLVSGYAGIGKSSLVNELHKALVPTRGTSLPPANSTYKRNIPYATLAQAFQSLVHQILGKSDSEMSAWRSALLEAIGAKRPAHGHLIPELALVIGDQPPVTDLPPQDRQKSLPAGIPAIPRRVRSGRAYRWRCSSTICNGWIPRPSILSNISSPIPRCAICC